MLRINLGSGQRRFGSPEAPWVNVDINPRWEPDVVADGSSMPMFDDGSAELIVTHHTLEHYGCGEGRSMVQECHRILSPGGSFVVCVPDMRVLCGWWLEGKMDTQLFLTNTYGAFMDSDADRHRWGFDRKHLTSFLKSCAPWTSINLFDWRTIPGADIACAEWVLAMEAIK